MYDSNTHTAREPRRSRLFALLIAGLFLAGCDARENIVGEPRVQSDITLINSGTMLLRCNGYCASELSIGPEDAIAISSGLDSVANPPQLRRSGISATEWNDLVGSVELDTFMALDTMIPGTHATQVGYEWIELEVKGSRKKVTFHYGDSVPPIETLLRKVRAIRGRVKI